VTDCELVYAIFFEGGGGGGGDGGGGGGGGGGGATCTQLPPSHTQSTFYNHNPVKTKNFPSAGKQCCDLTAVPPVIMPPLETDSKGGKFSRF
jgi:hypothetical protein